MDQRLTNTDDDKRLTTTPQATSVLALCEPVLNGMGYECVHLECNTGGSGLLRFYIDKPDGVDVHDCARASRQLSALLDVEDPIVDSYTLEVSSPGLNRPLSRVGDFTKHIGGIAKISTDAPVHGRRNWAGKILSVTGGLVSIEVQGDEVRIPFNCIQKANIEYQFEAVTQ